MISEIKVFWERLNFNEKYKQSITWRLFIAERLRLESGRNWVVSWRKSLFGNLTEYIVAKVYKRLIFTLDELNDSEQAETINMKLLFA